MSVWGEGNGDRWDATEGLTMYEVQWVDYSGLRSSVFVESEAEAIAMVDSLVLKGFPSRYRKRSAGK
jgi:hypothetical protein